MPFIAEHIISKLNTIEADSWSINLGCSANYLQRPAGLSRTRAYIYNNRLFLLFSVIPPINALKLKGIYKWLKLHQKNQMNLLYT